MAGPEINLETMSGLTNKDDSKCKNAEADEMASRLLNHDIMCVGSKNFKM